MLNEYGNRIEMRFARFAEIREFWRIGAVNTVHRRMSRAGPSEAVWLPKGLSVTDL